MDPHAPGRGAQAVDTAPHTRPQKPDALTAERAGVEPPDATTWVR
jgi:hypothetical protein